MTKRSLDSIMSCLLPLSNNPYIHNASRQNYDEGIVVFQLNVSAAINATENLNDSSVDNSNNNDMEIMGKYMIRLSQRVIIPAICVFGFVANLLNLLIFGRRLFFANSVNAIEKGAIISLAALAASDLLFCLITCLGSVMRTHRIVFTNYDMEYYYQMYSGMLQNVFIKTSTWLTMIAAISRCAVVCYPFHARQFIRLTHIKLAIFFTFSLSFLIHIPLLWTYDIKYLPCGNQSLKVFDTGAFMKNAVVNQCFTYIWSITGFLIPIIILCYCNTRLIIAFRQSIKNNNQLRRHQRKMSLDKKNSISDRFTITLISVVILFIILVSPSEILHFYELIAAPSDEWTFSVVLVSIRFKDIRLSVLRVCTF